MADTVLSHLASSVVPGIDVVFVDTGYHFPETIGTRDAAQVIEGVTRAPSVVYSALAPNLRGAANAVAAIARARAVMSALSPVGLATV